MCNMVIYFVMSYVHLLLDACTSDSRSRTVFVRASRLRSALGCTNVLWIDGLMWMWRQVYVTSVWFFLKHFRVSSSHVNTFLTHVFGSRVS